MLCMLPNKQAFKILYIRMPGSTFDWLFLSRLLSVFLISKAVCFFSASLDGQMIVKCKTKPNNHPPPQQLQQQKETDS